MCKTPELAAEVTLQPVRRLPFDAAIMFTDILTPVEPMGMEMDFVPGPVIREPVRTLEALRSLQMPAAGCRPLCRWTR